MSHDDILDDMSLSDDDMLDSLADDMLMEMEQDIPAIEPVRRAPAPVARAVQQPVGGLPPNLGQMMSQMMPMMSQMFGANNGAAGNPFANAMGGGAGGMSRGSIQQVQSMEEIVRQHVPAAEQDDWINTILADDQKLRTNKAQLEKPHSRSYRKNPNPLPNVFMEVETLLANLVNEAVRVAHCEHQPRWKEYHGNLVSQLTQLGAAKAFERDFKTLLRDRVENDPDFLALKDTDKRRFSNITQALSV